MAPTVMSCSEGKRLSVEALQAAEELYRLLNMQLNCVLRRESHDFLERRIERTNRKLNQAKAKLKSHLAKHGCGIDPTAGLCDYSLE